jgi:hypothetical protein
MGYLLVLTFLTVGSWSSSLYVTISVPLIAHGGSWKASRGAVRIEYFEKYKTHDARDGGRDAASKT